MYFECQRLLGLQRGEPFDRTRLYRQLLSKFGILSLTGFASLGFKLTTLVDVKAQYSATYDGLGSGSRRMSACTLIIIHRTNFFFVHWDLTYCSQRPIGLAIVEVIGEQGRILLGTV